MNKFITLAALLAAGTVCAHAGTAFYWMGGTSAEFGAEGMWRHEISYGNYDYIKPATYDTLEKLTAAIATGEQPITETTAETTYKDGYDCVLGGGSGTKVISVNEYYYVNGLYGSQWSNEPSYTFSFGQTGAIYSYYLIDFSKTIGGFSISVDTSGVDTKTNSSRVLFASSGSQWTKLSISETNLSNLNLSVDENSQYVVDATVYTDDTISTFVSGTEAKAALYYSAAGKSISVVYLASVPEPSAFGLLAGIGALALVASRRRRK